MQSMTMYSKYRKYPQFRINKNTDFSKKKGWCRPILTTVIMFFVEILSNI